MKFGEHLRSHLTPEWHSQYLAYEEIKDMLETTMDKIPQISSVDSNFSREDYFLQADNELFAYCERESTKINTFFIEKLAEALLRIEFLKNELEGFKKIHRPRRFTINNILHRREVGTNANQAANGVAVSNRSNKNSSRFNIRKLKINNSKDHNSEVKRHRFRTRNDLKAAFSEFYLMLTLLKDYQTLNYTGFRKILKKHDKLFETTRGNEWRKSYIDSATFHTSTRVDELMNEVETIYINELESGDRARAMQRLRVPPLEEKQPRVVTFRLGMFVGMVCVLIPLLIILGTGLFGNQSSKSIDWRTTFHIYRSSFLVILHVIFFGINVYGWSKSGVNHVLIFEINPRNHLTYQKFLELGTFLIATWLISVCLFLISSYLDFYPLIQPLIFAGFLVLFIINPLPIFYRQSRYWFLRKLLRVFSAPFYQVDFVDFWLGDQLCSLELVFFDLEFFFCFHINPVNWRTSNPTRISFCPDSAQISLQIFFLMLPSWFRFAQCLRRYRDTQKRFPHLVNAGKYASTFFVIIINALRRAKFLTYRNQLENPFLYIWIIINLISTTYKVFWDLKMDWGFFNENAGKNKFLREQIIYSRKFYYYTAIIGNILFRYIWLINLFIQVHSLFGEYSDIIGFTFGLIELFRRFIWNYFRLENEHLNNCGAFRAVRDISIRSLPNNLDLFGREQSQRQEGENRRRSLAYPVEDGTAINVRTRTAADASNNRFPLISNLYRSFGNLTRFIRSK